jgi:hypothetical protein
MPVKRTRHVPKMSGIDNGLLHDARAETLVDIEQDLACGRRRTGASKRIKLNQQSS